MGGKAGRVSMHFALRSHVGEFSACPLQFIEEDIQAVFVISTEECSFLFAVPKVALFIPRVYVLR